ILGPISLSLACPAVYLIAVFSYGFEADVNARESSFPAGMLRLPVSTGALAGWPMVYGAAAGILLWLVIALFFLRPWLSLWNLQVALWWPAALTVATLAWFQAMLWCPLGLPGLRIVLTTAVISSVIAFSQYAVEAGIS